MISLLFGTLFYSICIVVITWELMWWLLYYYDSISIPYSYEAHVLMVILILCHSPRLGCLWSSIALTVQNCGLIHQTFIHSFIDIRLTIIVFWYYHFNNLLYLLMSLIIICGGLGTRLISMFSVLAVLFDFFRKGEALKTTNFVVCSHQVSGLFFPPISCTSNSLTSKGGRRKEGGGGGGIFEAIFVYRKVCALWWVSAVWFACWACTGSRNIHV